MTKKLDVDAFLKQKKLAVVGVSRQMNKTGNVIYRTLKKSGYQVFPVNPFMETFDGDRCYPDLKSLPEPVTGVVIVIPPEQVEKVLKDAAAANIPFVWLQLKAGSDAAVQFCRENNMTVVSGECIFMFIEPVTSVHKFHRWLWKIFGKLPK